MGRYVTQWTPTRTGDWRYVRPVFRSAMPPCTQGCPAGLRVREYVALALDGRMEEAWRLVKEDNPIPAITGRVCYHPCEQSCHRGAFDEPVAVHAIERNIGDYGLEHHLQVSVVERRREKIAVVGSGPTGLSAAYHLARIGYDVTVFERMDRPGGMLRQGIPAYRLPRDILDAEIDGITALGVEFMTNAAVGEQVSWDDLGDYSAVFLGTGCPRSRGLDVPGAELEGITDGLSFLRAVNLRQRMKVGSKVLVIGGGNVAVDVGRAAIRLGAGEVMLAFPEPREEMSAHSEERQAAVAEGVTLLPRRHPLRILGDGGRVVGALFEMVISFDIAPSGQLTVEPVAGSEHVVEADSIVISIGQKADFSFLPGELQEQRDSFRSRDPVRLGTQWVMAGGDMVTGPTRVVDAIGAGKRASTAIDSLLRRQNPPVKKVAERQARYGDLNLSYFRHKVRSVEPLLDPARSREGFAEVADGLTPEAVIAEAARCFNCFDCNLCGNCWVFCPEMSIRLDSVNGTSKRMQITHPEIELATCKGCGICVRECPRSALVLEEEYK